MYIHVGISYDGSDVMTSPRGSLGSQISCPSDKPIFGKILMHVDGYIVGLLLVLLFWMLHRVVHIYIYIWLVYSWGNFLITYIRLAISLIFIVCVCIHNKINRYMHVHIVIV